jgi:hypothetical protein
MKADSVTETGPPTEGEPTEPEPSILLSIDVRDLRARVALVGGEFVLLVGDGESALAIEQSSLMTDPNGSIDALITFINEVDRFKELLETRIVTARRALATNVIPFPDLGGATPSLAGGARRSHPRSRTNGDAGGTGPA